MFEEQNNAFISLQPVGSQLFSIFFMRNLMTELCLKLLEQMGLSHTDARNVTQEALKCKSIDSSPTGHPYNISAHSRCTRI